MGIVGIATLTAVLAAHADNTNQLERLLSQQRLPGEFILAFESSKAAEAWATQHSGTTSDRLDDARLLLVHGTDDETAFEFSIEHPEIGIVPNLIGRLTGIQDPSGGFFPSGLDRIDQRDNLATTSSYYQWSTSGRGTTVYIMDDELRLSHDDFVALPGELRTCTNAWNSMNSAGRQDAHGTQMASIAAGIRAGVAKSANIKGVDVYGTTIFGYAIILSDVLNGLTWIESDVMVNPGPAVVNMSFEFPSNTTLNNKIDQISTTRQVVFVVAAGNDSDDASNYSPASAKHALTVGGLNQLGVPMDTLLSVSNYGSDVELFAPAATIMAADTANDSSYAAYGDGTSQATAHVTGIVARYLETHPQSTASSARAAVVANATQNAINGTLPSGTPNLIAFSDFTASRINESSLVTTTNNDIVTAIRSFQTFKLTAGTHNGNAAVFCGGIGSPPRRGSDIFVRIEVGGTITSWIHPMVSNCTSSGDWRVASVHIGTGGYIYAVLTQSTDIPPAYSTTRLYKFTMGGSVVWSRQIGANATLGTGLAITTIGSTEYIVVTGRTSDTIPGTTPIGATDGFVVAHDNFGVQQWAHKVGSSGGENIGGLATNPFATRLYLLGSTNGVVPGAVSLSGVPVTANLGGTDAIIIEFRTDGTPGVTRSVQFGGSDADALTAGAYDALNNRIVVAGQTYSTLASPRLGGGSQDAFWLSLSNSTFHQATGIRQFGSATHETVAGVFVPSLTGDVYLAGSTNGSLSFGANPDANSDVFVAKYSANGGFLWDWQSLRPGAESGGLLASDDQYSDGPARLFLAGGTDATGWPTSGGLGGWEAFSLTLEGY